MKRLLTLFFVMSLMFSSMPVSVCYAGEYQDNPVDQAGDWFATLGKRGIEKDRVLAERKAERLARHAEREAKKAQKEAEKAGGDVKKKLGF